MKKKYCNFPKIEAVSSGVGAFRTEMKEIDYF